MPRFHFGLYILILSATGKAVNIPETSLSSASCEDQVKLGLYNTLQVLLDGWKLNYIVMITDEDDGVLPVQLGRLGVSYKLISCHDRDALRREYEIHPGPTLGGSIVSTVLINCNKETTESIISYLMGTRGTEYTRSRLLAPFYNIIASGTAHLNLSHIREGNLHGNKLLYLQPDISSSSSSSSSSSNCSYRTSCPAVMYRMYELIKPSHWRYLGVYRCNTYYGHRPHLLDTLNQLNGIHLSIATELYTPFVIRSSIYPGFKGYCMEFLEIISSRLNFSYDIRRSVDKKFGVKLSNGEWNGLIGMLGRKDVDLVATGLTIGAQREEMVDFTLPIWEETSAVVVKVDKNKTDILNWSYILSPFNRDLWLAVLVILSASMILYVAMDIAEKHVRRRSSTHQGKANIGTDYITNSFLTHSWFVIGTTLRQGVHVLPTSRAGRCVSCCFWLALLILCGTYCANLTAALSTSSVTPPVENLRQLADDPRFDILLNPGSAQRLLLEGAKDGVFTDLWRKIQDSNSLDDSKGTTTNLRKMFADEDRNYAVMADYTSLKTKLGRDYSDTCNWALVPETFFTSGFGFALPEGSPYKEMFDKMILKIMQSGMDRVWQEKYFYETFCGITGSSVNASAKAVTFGDVTALLALVGAGLAMSFLCFMAEMCFPKGQMIFQSIYRRTAANSLIASNEQRIITR